MYRSWSDDLLGWVLRGAATLAGAIVLFILVFLIWESLPALAHLGPGAFVFGEGWHPGEQQFVLLPMIAGSLAVALGALLLATPLGILSAIFCHSQSDSWVVRPFRLFIQLLAGIPSVLYGFWGLVTLVPLIARWQPPGASLLAGILILALMILPTVALLADASLARVPAEYLRGAAALGLGPWACMRQVLLPAARPGIQSGIFLALARALGETMAVLMVCGNVVQVPTGLFTPMRTLTAGIALEMSYAMGDHRAALFVISLVLFALTMLLVTCASRGSGERSHV